MKHNTAQGFTLIELMIVVAIIAIISAIAIPNLLRARLHSNEASAVSNLRTIGGAQAAYHGSNFVYALDFADLVGATPPFLDGDWTGVRFGYGYIMGGDAQNFTCNANAETYGLTGNRGFFVDATGIIRFAVAADADATSTPISQ